MSTSPRKLSKFLEVEEFMNSPLIKIISSETLSEDKENRPMY